MKFKEELDGTLIEALEAIQHELRKLDFYRQAAEDNLERLQGILTRAQCGDVERLDHSIQRSRDLVKNARVALEEVIRSVLERRSRPVKLRRRR